MFSPIVRSLEPVTLVGGGLATRADLHEALRYAPMCVAADGGAALAVQAGVDIAAVIGDFDSVDAHTLAHIPSKHQHHISEQDSTDFEKALVRIAAPVVIGVGFLGGRLDHQLAALHVLAAVPERRCILVGEHEVICLTPPALTLPTEAGDVVSLFPLGKTGGRSSGLRWPIDGLAFDLGTKIGTSNAATGSLTLQADTPAMLVILPRRVMPALVGALSLPTGARWPARA